MMSAELPESVRTWLGWQLFEQVPCLLVVLDRDLRVVRANELARRTFGDRVGEHCYRMYKGRDRRCERCPALQTFEDGEPHHSEQLGLDRRGDFASFVVSTAPVSSSNGRVEHVIEMSVDVTETQRLTRQLLSEGQFRRNLTENALDALVAADASGVTNIFNPAAESLFGVAASDVLGKEEPWRFFPVEFVELVRQGGGSLELHETTVRDAAGEEIPVRFSGAVLREGERHLGGAAFLQDLRELKRMERDKLESERLAAVGQTVAQLAHGIKNVLTGLQGGMYALRTGLRRGSAERTERGWVALERNVDRITELVKGFLSLSRGGRPATRPTDPRRLAGEVIVDFSAAAADSGVQLVLADGPEVQVANLDPKAMQACLENLVSNAIDACKVADNQDSNVTLRVTDEGGVLVFEVVDTGCGMDYEVKSKVFTTFFSTKGAGGTGLGLLASRKIVSEHGGRIEVESMPGRGSSFRIELPRDQLPEPATDATEPP